MQLDEPVAVLVRKICAEWNRAERAIKISEQVLGEDPFPPIKELRYSGRRVIEALEAVDEGKDDHVIEALLQDAYFDCLRAKHDAVDVAVNEIAGRLRIAERELDSRSVVRAYPQFPKLVRELADIEAKIAESRENRASRDEIYNEIQMGFDHIVSLYDGFKSSEAVMLAIADKKYASEQRLTKLSEAIGKASGVAVVGALLMIFWGSFEDIVATVQNLLGLH